jgi:lysophospholipase L1-like esterase
MSTDKIGLTDNQEILSYEQDESPKKIGSSFYRGKNINLNPYLSDWKKKNFIEKYLLKGLTPAEPIITKSTRITAFGSCFAENITKHLTARGYSLSKNEEPNIYISSMGEGMVNVHAILQQFKWALENEEIPRGLWHNTKTEEFDLDEETRKKTRVVFLKTEFFIITLGLSEIWYDEETGGVFWRAVPVNQFDEKKHKFRVATFAETKTALEQIIEIIKKHNPGAKVLFTLSPVPLAATFREISCIVANSASKAILRSALDEVIREKADQFNKKIFYFPSYEIVNELFSMKYCEDGRHPREEIINYIMALFENTYCIENEKNAVDVNQIFKSASEKNILGSSNYSSTYIGNDLTILEPKNLVQQIYQVLLGREPDQSGAWYYADLIEKTYSIKEVLKSITESEEYKIKTVD